jgi:hypothetical protein
MRNWNVPKEKAILKEDSLSKLKPVNLAAETERQSKAKLMEMASDEGSIAHPLLAENKDFILLVSQPLSDS